MESVQLSKAQIEELVGAIQNLQMARGQMQAAENRQKSILKLICDAHKLDVNDPWELKPGGILIKKIKPTIKDKLKKK